MTDLLDGTTGLVVGVANKRSIAWAIARRLDEAGARLALTYQNERTEGDVRKLAETLSHCQAVLPLDVQDDAQVASAVAGAAEALGGLDTLVHAVAFARAEDLGGRFVDTGREGFHTALDVSAYSLAALAREAEPHMRAGGGGSIMTMSYIAADRAVPGLQRDGGRQGGAGGDRPLPRVGPRRRRHPRQRDLGRAGAHAGRPRHPRLRLDGRPGRRARPAAARHHAPTRSPTPPSSWRRRCRPASPASRSSWTPASTRWGSRPAGAPRCGSAWWPTRTWASTSRPCPREVAEVLDGVDLILHAGDLTDAVGARGAREDRAGRRGARATTTRRRASAACPRDAVVEAGGRRIGLTHGARTKAVELPAAALVAR